MSKRKQKRVEAWAHVELDTGAVYEIEAGPEAEENMHYAQEEDAAECGQSRVAYLREVRPGEVLVSAKELLALRRLGRIARHYVANSGGGYVMSDALAALDKARGKKGKK